MIINRDEYSTEYPYINYNDNIIDFDTYINMINNDGVYAGELELNTTGKIYNLDILILEYKKNTKDILNIVKSEIMIIINL